MKLRKRTHPIPGIRKALPPSLVPCTPMARRLVGRMFAAIASLEGSQIGRVIGVKQRRDQVAEDVAVGVIQGVLAVVFLASLGETLADHLASCR